MVLLEVWEVVYFSGHEYVPLRESVGVEVVGLVLDVEVRWATFGVEFEASVEIFVFDPPVL